VVCVVLHGDVDAAFEEQIPDASRCFWNTPGEPERITGDTLKRRQKRGQYCCDGASITGSAPVLLSQKAGGRIVHAFCTTRRCDAAEAGWAVATTEDEVVMYGGLLSAHIPMAGG
jgi:hypothetical protein